MLAMLPASQASDGYSNCLPTGLGDSMFVYDPSYIGNIHHNSLRYNITSQKKIANDTVELCNQNLFGSLFGFRAEKIYCIEFFNIQLYENQPQELLKIFFYNSS